jgi:hypothetical protein
VLAVTVSSVCPLNKRSCQCDPSAPKDSKFYPCRLAKRLGTMIRLLGSNFEDEALNTARAMRRFLPERGLNFSDLALLIENCDGRLEALCYSEAEAKAIFERGIERGKTQANGRCFSDRYFDDDGEPRWLEMAKYCQSNPAKTSLKSNEQEFIDELSAKLRWRTPTRPMSGFLLSIFWKLRGSFK